MPIYEYECESCSKTTQVLRRMSEADDPLACEHCGHEQTHRAHSVFATGNGSESQAGPDIPPCGQCGDPRGSCGI